jgi:hypothetical protein
MEMIVMGSVIKTSAVSLCCIFVFPGSGLAQHKGPRAGESDQEYSQRLARESAEAAQQYVGLNSGYESKRQREEPQLNSTINGLSKNANPLEAQTEFMNNVTSLRTKDAMQKWVEEKRKKWDAEAGPHIRIANPYDGSLWERYYTKETTGKDGKRIDGGDLVVSRVKDSYELLERDREAWDQSFKRAKQAADSLNNDYVEVVRQYGLVTAIKAELADARRTEILQQPDQTRPVRPENSTADIFAGKWAGSWKNSFGESSPSSLVLTKQTDGTFSGSWDGVKVNGKAIDEDTIELEGKNTMRSYRITGTLRGRVLSLKYVATRLDDGRKYTGEVTLKGSR